MDALITGAGEAGRGPREAPCPSATQACTIPVPMVPAPMTPIVCVDVTRRTLAPAIRGVVSETSGLRGDSAEIASAAVAGVTLGMQGSSARVPLPRRVRAPAVKPKRDEIPTFRL